MVVVSFFQQIFTIFRNKSWDFFLHLGFSGVNLTNFLVKFGLIIIVVHIRRVKIYVAAVEELRKKERQDETQFTSKIDGFLSFNPA